MKRLTFRYLFGRGLRWKIDTKGIAFLDCYYPSFPPLVWNYRMQWFVPSNSTLTGFLFGVSLCGVIQLFSWIIS